MVCRGALCKPVWHRVFLLPDPSAVAAALLQSRNCLELKSAAQRGLAVTEAQQLSPQKESGFALQHNRVVHPHRRC